MPRQVANSGHVIVCAGRDQITARFVDCRPPRGHVRGLALGCPLVDQQLGERTQQRLRLGSGDVRDGSHARQQRPFSP